MANQGNSTVPTVPNGAERNPDGTFVVGNRAAVGRTTKPAELRRALENAVTAEDVERLAKSLLKQVELGDVPAAKLLLDKVVPSITIETEVRRRIDAWKMAFLDELLLATSHQVLRDRIVGQRTTADEQTLALLDLLGRLEAFREGA